jgi:hypothetical protein
MILFGVALIAIAAAVFFLRQELKEEFGYDEYQEENPELKKPRKKKTDPVTDPVQTEAKTEPLETV